MDKLKQIDLAMQNYVSTYGHFPPAATVDENGKPLMSWRVAIMPFLDRMDTLPAVRFHAALG